MKSRLQLVDTVRGFALLIMFAYHFAFDLDLFGAAQVNFHALFWVAYRSLILVLFLSLVGVSVALAGRPWPDLFRVVRLAASSALITAATWFLFPGAPVLFGVLHFVLLASVVGPLFARSPFFCLPLGVALAALPFLFRSTAFDGGIGMLTGLGTRLPHTIDFVPLCPWLGVVLLGIFAGARLPRERRTWLEKGNAQLAFLGRHSLPLYLSHQGLLLPLAWLAARLFGR